MATATLPAAETGNQVPKTILSELNYDQRVAALTVERDEIHKNFKGLRGFRLPRTQARIQLARHEAIKTELIGLTRIKRAIDSGYQPYAIPSTWWAGLLDDVRMPQRWSDDEAEADPFHKRSVLFYFAAPIPEQAITKLRTAKKSGLFDGFLVGAPDGSLFKRREEAPRPISMLVDPVLVGYVIHDPANARVIVDRSYGSMRGYTHTSGMQGFLIDHWDLSGDLAFDR